MKGYLNYLLIAFVLFVSMPGYSQERLYNPEEWIDVNEDLLYNLVIATDKEHKITRGLLSGMRGDSIYLLQSNKLISLNVKDLLLLSIEGKKTKNRGFVFGIAGGMYLGSLLLLTSEDLSSKYLEYDEIGVLALYETAFATVGGLIGYLIDQSSANSEQFFYFNKDNDGIDKETDRLQKFLLSESSDKNFKFNFYLSQVSTRLSEVSDEPKYNSGYTGSYYSTGSSEIHNFNLVRRISLTYGLFENLDLGLAMTWFGEPALDYYLYDWQYPYTTSKSISQTYDGVGYYLALNFSPLNNITSDNFELIIGGGLGFGNADFNYKNETVTQTESGQSISEIKEINFDKTMLSYFIAGELKFYIYSDLSISLQADYLYLPEKIPAIEEFNVEERNLGNFSYGLGLGFNF